MYIGSRKVSEKWEKNLLELLKRLWIQITPQRRKQGIVVVVLMILASAAEVVSIGALFPFLEVLSNPEKVFNYAFVKDFALEFNIERPDQLLLPITLIFIVATFISGAMRIFLIWYQTRLGYSIGADLSFKIFRKTLYQPYLTHINRNSAELISTIATKTNYIVGGIVMPSLILLSSTFIFLAIISLMVYFNPLMMISAITIFGIIYAVVAFASNKKISQNGKRINQESNNVVKALQEGLGGIRDVIINNVEDVYCKIYRLADVPMRKAMASNSFLAQSPRFVVEAIGVSLIAAIAYIFSSNDTNINELIPLLGVMALSAQRLLPVLQQFYSSWASAKGAQALLVDTLILLEQEDFQIANETSENKVIFKKSIELKNANFNYKSTNDQIFNDVNIVINKGDKVGIIGETGSGKSTLLDILMGLIPLEKGCLLIDDLKLTSKNTRGWQDHIAHVPQAIFLADTTIANNIAFGISPDQINHEKLKYVSKKSQIFDMINTLEDGYDSYVGERGVKLSGGERQRIGIARALYKSADVIVFDEATSALDTSTETEVTQAIESLGSEITTIIVAHRLSTLKGCNKIFEVSNKDIKDIGSYADMLKALSS